MPIYDRDGVVRYDEVIDQPVYRYYVNKKLSLISNWFEAKSVLLDVGCGTGVYAVSLARKCEAIVGVDISPEMIMRGFSKARRLGLDNVYFVIGDVANSVERPVFTEEVRLFNASILSWLL